LLFTPLCIRFNHGLPASQEQYNTYYPEFIARSFLRDVDNPIYVTFYDIKMLIIASIICRGYLDWSR
jgi:hypothetical protein